MEAGTGVTLNHPVYDVEWAGIVMRVEDGVATCRTIHSPETAKSYRDVCKWDIKHLSLA